jgi:cysteine synthase A
MLLDFTKNLLTETGIAAVKTARALGPGHRIVTILCDSGTRHISKFWAIAGNVGGKTDSKLEDIIGPNNTSDG